MSKHVIFSRNNNNGTLSNERIMQLAPAVFATSKHERLTDRYVSLHTSDIIPVMQDYGYEPVQAAQRRARGTGVLGEHSHHMVAFAKPADVDSGIGFRPEIILYNSHDGSGAVRLFAGCFRFICSNGIIAGEGFASRSYHNKGLLAFEDILRSTVEKLPNMLARIEFMRTVRLSQQQVMDMAAQCVATRWDMYDGQERGSYATEYTIRDVVKAQRNEDTYQDAWTVFNRLQENVLRGNVFIKSLTDKGTTERKARPIANIKEHVRINSELWNIADEYSTAAA